MDISTGKKSHKMQFFYGLLSVVFSPWILAPTRSTSGIYGIEIMKSPMNNHIIMTSDLL